MTEVPSIGPEKARIMFICESPSEYEVRDNCWFASTSGKVLDKLLQDSGLCKEHIYITSISHTFVSNFSTLYEKVKGKKVPTAELLKSYQRIYNEIVSTQPNVIVPLTNEALRVLGITGNITNLRGSILSSPYGKVIPTLHPSAVLRDWTIRPGIVSDFKRIATESIYPDIRLKQRSIITNPSFTEVINEIQRLKESKEVAFDIEIETEQINAISLSDSAQKAISIPFWFGNSGSLWSQEQEARIWLELRHILESDTPFKIAHNGLFDIEYLKRNYDINTNLKWDTMLMFHTLYSELPKGLDYLTSIYTDVPYYKDTIDSPDSQTFWRYNALDACCTYECFTVLRNLLDKGGLTSFYREYVHSLVNPLLDMQLRGVRFDTQRRNELRAQYRKELEELSIRLKEQVGYDLNTSSNPQMLKWLYEELKLTPRYKLRKGTREKTLTADEEALNDIYQETKSEAIGTILAIRERKKIYTTYLDIQLDSDNRVRCSYNIAGTETGRLSSGTTTRGTGTNLQNVPKGDVKRLFLADGGCVLLNADLSQAEARVVAYVSGETRLIKVFEDGGDIHRRNAATIFNKQESEVTDDERQMAKRVVHASNYGMGPNTFAQTANLSTAVADKLLKQYFATYPRIKTWHMQIQDQLRRTRILTNPLGRKRLFFNEWSDSLLKEALAFIPQSTVADIVTKALVHLHSRGIETLLQVHDSIVVQCAKDTVKETAQILKSSLTQPIPIQGKTLIIPVDVKWGTNWEDMAKLEEGT